MFRVDVQYPIKQQFSRRLASDTRRGKPQEVESRVSELVQKLGDRRYLKRRNKAAKAKRLEVAKYIHVDPKDPKKVYAVGLMALRKAGVLPTKEERGLFMDACEKYRKNGVESQCVDVDEVDYSLMDYTDQDLNELEKIICEDSDTQLKRDLTDWIANCRRLGPSKESAEAQLYSLGESILICPITYQSWENPVLCSDGRTYEAEKLKQLKKIKGKLESPITSETINIVRTHLEAKLATLWLKNRQT